MNSYIDEKQLHERLREFFLVEGRNVNIYNICFFAARTVETYNLNAEDKTKETKPRMIIELAKSIIVFLICCVPEEDRWKYFKNVYKKE